MRTETWLARNCVSWIALVVCISIVAAPRIVWAAAPADEKAAESTKAESKSAEYEPVTTFNTQLPLDQLRVLVRPLTRSELEVEADAWFELLRQKAKEIAAVRLGVKKTNAALATDSVEQAKTAVESARSMEAKAAETSAAAEKELTAKAKRQLGVVNTNDDESANEDQKLADDNQDANNEDDSDMTQVASAKKNELLVTVNKLQDERTSHADRLKIVLDSLEAKGGDPAEYRKYISAVSGIELDAQDASASWSAITGWVTSQEGGQRWAWNFGKFLLILAISWLAAKFVARITNWLLERRLKLSKLAENLISRTIKNVILLIGFAIALTALEIDITPILAAIGAAGFIIGFALQGTLSNFASGLMILINRPFDVGDAVTAGGVTGKIHEMNLVSTTFRTFDNQTIHVPNNEIWGNVITNITANDERRVDLEFGIGYDDDFEEAERIIREIVEDHELVLSYPEPEIALFDLGDSSVNIVCRPWARTSDWWKVKTEVTRRVKQRFDEAGISIPYPQSDVHVYRHNTNTNSHANVHANSHA